MINFGEEKWSRLISNPNVMNLKSFKNSLLIDRPIFVTHRLEDLTSQDAKITIGIMFLDDTCKGIDYFEDLFILTCRNFVFLGGQLSIVGALSLLTHIYPTILNVIRTSCAKLGVHTVIEPLTIWLEAEEDNLNSNLANQQLRMIDCDGYRLKIEERYAITKLYSMMLTKRIGDQGKNWLDNRIATCKGTKVNNPLILELYNIDKDSWNEVHDYMSLLHDLRAVILTKFLTIEPGVCPGNTTLRTTRVLMKWSGCAHLSAIDQVMSRSTSGFTSASSKWYSHDMALYRWYRSELGELFPYCRLLLTIESSDVVGRKQVAEFAAFCSHFSPNKTTLQNVTKPANDQEQEISDRAKQIYEIVNNSINETVI